MSITTSNGVLFSTPVNGGSFSPSISPMRGELISSPIMTESDISANSSMLGELIAQATSEVSRVGNVQDMEGVLTASIRAYAKFINLETAKLSDYTVLEPLQDHTANANDNLIMQFKDCPNILKFLSVPLLELDKASEDVRDFQEFILNLEQAVGVNLDLLGMILGQARVEGQDDIEYRNILFSQVQIITCDGTLIKVLTAMLMRYNYNLDERSANKISIRTLSNNVMQVYVSKVSEILNNGGYQFVDKLTAGGGEAFIIVSDDNAVEGEFFTLESSVLELYQKDTYEWDISNGDVLPDSIEETLVLTGELLSTEKVELIENPAGDAEDDFLSHWFGTFRIVEDGEYTFKIETNEGAKLYIDNKLVVVNDDGLNSDTTRVVETVVSLDKGVKLVSMLFFDRSGQEYLDLKYKGPDTNDVYVDPQPYVISNRFGVPDGGLGLGSTDEPSEGGQLVGQLNRDLNGTLDFIFGLEGSVGTKGLNEGRLISRLVTEEHANPEKLTTDPLPTTTSTVPVPTFGI